MASWPCSFMSFRCCKMNVQAFGFELDPKNSYMILKLSSDGPRDVGLVFGLNK